MRHLSDERLIRLLADVRELDRFEMFAAASVGRPVASRGWLRAAAGISAAAAVVALSLNPSVYRGAAPVAPRNDAAWATPAASSKMTLETCVDQESFAVVLLRAWNAECRCLLWDVHHFADGQPLAHLPAGQAVNIAFSTPTPGIAEPIALVAVAQRPDDLPETPAEAAELVKCLNAEATDPSHSVVQPSTIMSVAACLPADVRVLSEPLVRR